MKRSVALSRASVCPDGAIVLLVDDDLATLEMTSALLRYLPVQVHTVSSGTAAVDTARRERFDLALIDLRLPDMSGLDIARALRAEQINIPWILTSGYMDFEVAVEAGRLGALGAVSSPFDVHDVVTQALAEVRSARRADWPALPLASRLRDAQSAAERCAWLILRGCDAGEDPKTLRDWASVAVVGYSTLRRACDVVHVQPYDARDFTRVMRVLMRTGGRTDLLEAHLKFCDLSTLATLVERAGLSPHGRSRVLTLEQYLLAQRFIGADHPVLTAIRALVATM